MAEQKEERWTKGRAWDGIGPWCDEQTAEHWSKETERFSRSDPNITIPQLIESIIPVFGEKRALTYLDVNGKEICNMSYDEVWASICKIAAYLQSEVAMRQGETAVLLYPPGPEFILAFLACLKIGVVAVPVYPPHPFRFENDVPGFARIVANSQCKVCLTDSQYMMVITSVAVKNMLSRVGMAKSVQWPNLRNIQTDKIRASYAHNTLLHEPQIQASDLAFLQYTSGSTSAPKGVMVSHGNLLAQEQLLALRAVEVIGWTNNPCMVSWLPQYHDMGLMGAFLASFVTGLHIVYMTPITFLQDPTQWLIAVSKYKAEITVGPNFAFALAQRKTSEELRNSLDLSSLKLVSTGAEPVRKEVMDAFCEYFAPCGFNPLSITPCYGLAEFTLCATSHRTGDPMAIIHVDQRRLSETGEVVVVQEGAHGAACYVGVGGPHNDGSVCRIVDPHTCVCAGEGRSGEIWLDGPSKTQGYFHDEDKTAQAFRGTINGEEHSGRTYLQTGDQGFIYNGQLFITGRIKDLIIVRGRNLYPQDIEYEVEEVLSELLRPGCSAAFSHEQDSEETVAYVAELREKLSDRQKLQEAVNEIRKVVADHFQVSVSAVVLLEPRSVPKTTSGKIQRHKTKLRFYDGTLKEVYRWQQQRTADDPLPAEAPLLEDLDESFTSAVSEADELMTDDEELAGDGKSGEREATGGESAVDLVEVDDGGGGGHTRASLDVDHKGEVTEVAPEVQARTADYMERLIAYTTSARNIPREAVDVDQHMTIFGFDSVAFVALGRTMGEWVGKDISPAIIYKFTTIREVAGFLARGAREEELSGEGDDEKPEPDLHCLIAIVGIGVTAAGGPTLGNLNGADALWRFMVEGKSGLRPDMPSERKVDRSVKVPGYYLDGVDRFDHEFFDISSAEAAHMDYHQSLTLETAWHALEDAGIDPTTLQGKSVGVYIGALSHEFAALQALRGEDSVFKATGSGNSLIAGRVSHVLNLRGPAAVVDTACSSAAVAVHNAVTDLRLGTCTMALAGGVNLLLTSEVSAALKRSGLLADDNRPFDADAQGFCRGEGCGIVVLKRLANALADNDRVYAVIKGTAVVHDGRTQNLTTPNPLAQETVIKAALKDAGITAHQLRYIEAHGAGTRLGDTMEIAALAGVMSGRDPSDPCLLGSGKANVGYLEAACGVMSIIRASLVLYHGTVPKQVNFVRANPAMPWERLPFRIPTATTPLENDATCTVFAGFTSVGFSGTNVHMVLESLPSAFGLQADFKTVEEEASSSSSTQRTPLLLLLSSKSERSLHRLASAYVELLSSDACRRYDRAAELCLQANTRRTQHKEFRLAAMGRSAAELKQSIVEQLEARDRGETGFRSAGEGVEPEVAFICGAHAYVGMGRDLYEGNVVFRTCMDEADKLLAPMLYGVSVVETVVLADTRGSQPSKLLLWAALFAVEYSMTKVWGAMGVKPTMVIGYSCVGEIVAAVVAGCISMQDGARLLCAGARATEEEPASEDVIRAVASEVRVRAPGTVKMLSVAAQGLLTTAPDAAHWIKIMIGAAGGEEQAHEGLRVLCDGKPRVAVDIGPEGWLLDAARRIVSSEAAPVSIVTSMARQHGCDETAHLTSAFAVAFVSGMPLNFSSLKGMIAPLSISLPLYPFEPTVAEPLGKLVSTALGKIATSDKSRPKRDYGITYLLDAAWFPRVRMSRTSARRPPPSHTVFICSDPADAVALAGVKALAERSTKIVVPGGSEHMDARLLSVDFSLGSQTVLSALRCPEADMESMTVVYVASTSVMGGPLQHATDEAVRESSMLRSVLAAVAGMSRIHTVRLWVVTTQAKVVMPGDQVRSLSGGPLWALTKSALQRGYPSLWATLLDLPGHFGIDVKMRASQPQELTAAASAFVDMMDRETAWSSSHDPPLQLAFRHGRWMVMRLRQAELEGHIDRTALVAAEGMPDTFPMPGVDIEFRRTRAKQPEHSGKEGWHLIWGALSPVGLQAAAALVRHGARRLLLTSRSGELSGGCAAEINALTALRTGLDIRKVTCDVTNRSAVAQLFADVAGDGGICGVVYCECLSPDIRDDQEALEKGLWDRVRGAINVHEFSLKQPGPMDLFVLYGSSSSLLGAARTEHAAAANAALDGLAHMRRQHGLPATCVQWGQWSVTNVDSLSSLEQLQQQAATGLLPVTRSLGALVLTALLNQDQRQSAPALVCCQPIEWSRMAANGPEYMLKTDLASFEAVANRANANAAEPVKMTEDMRVYGELDSSAARLEMVQCVLTRSVQERTGKEVCIDQNLLETGITMTNAVEMVEDLCRRFPIKFEFTNLLKWQTIEKLAPVLASELDAVVDDNITLPLCRVQLAAASMGLALSFVLAELQLPGSIGVQRLLAAWTQLIGRHSALRTTVEVYIDRNGATTNVSGFQRTVRVSEVRVGEMFETLAMMGPVRDLRQLEIVVAEAGERMASVPPARLMVAMGRASMDAYLAVSRLLVDKASLQLLASELLALCRADIALAPARPSLVEHMEKWSPRTPCEAVLETRVTDASDALSTASSDQWSEKESGAASASWSVSGRGAAEPSSAGSEGAFMVLKEQTQLLPRLLQDLDTHVTKAGVAPSVVYLSAYAAALCERSSEESLRVRVDLPGLDASVIGPLCVPFVLTLHVNEARKGPRDFARYVQRLLMEQLEALKAPATDEPTPKDVGLNTALLPAFRYEANATDMHLSSVGDAPVVQLVELVVTAGQAGPLSQQLELYARSDVPGPHVEGFMDSVLRHLEHVVRPSSNSQWHSSYKAAICRSRGGKLRPFVEEEKDGQQAESPRHRSLPYPVIALVQLVGMVVMGVVLMIPVLIVWPALQAALDHLGLYVALVLCPFAYNALGLILLTEVCVLRRLFGTSTTGAYPINSVPFLRWWFMRRLVAFVGPVYGDHIQGTELYTWWLRGLGARIGSNVRFLPGAKLPDPEMVVIGDDAVIGKARLVGAVVRDGLLRSATVEVCSGARLDTHAMMLPGSTLGASALLKPLSVAAEGQTLYGNGVFQGSPACFVQMNGVVGSPRRVGKQSVLRQLAHIGLQVAQLLLGPALATVAASLGYILMAALAESAGIYPFLEWSAWQEGRLLLALATSTGIVPMLGVPVVIAYMRFSCRALLLPDVILTNVAKAAGFSVQASQIRRLFMTEQGVKLLKNTLLPGITVYGTPGEGLRFVATGTQVIRHATLDGVVLPAATMYYVIGTLWVFTTGFLLQGMILTALTNIVHWALVALVGRGRDTVPRRADGFKARIRQIKVSILLWTYDRFMQLFSGTDLVLLWYRTLGARMGRRVTIADVQVLEDPHLVELGDDVVLVDSAEVKTCLDLGNGYEVNKEVCLERGVVLSVRAVVAAGAQVGGGGIVMPQSLVEAGQRTEKGAVLSGVPAVKIFDVNSLLGPQRLTRNTDETSNMSEAPMGGSDSLITRRAHREGLFGGFLQLVFIPFVSASFTLLLAFVAAYPPSIFLFWAMAHRGLAWQPYTAQMLLPFVYMGFSVCLLLLVVAQKWLLRWRTSTGTSIAMRSATYHLRTHTLVLQSYANRACLQTVCSTVFAPSYLSMLGASVHWTAYVDTLHVTDPDLVEVGEMATLDQDATLMPNTLEQGKLNMGRVRVEKGARLGVASAVLRDCCVGRSGELGDASYLLPMQKVRPGDLRRGSALATTMYDEEQGAAPQERFVTLTLKV